MAGQTVSRSARRRPGGIRAAISSKAFTVRSLLMFFSGSLLSTRTVRFESFRTSPIVPELPAPDLPSHIAPGRVTGC
eukprot:762734-Hanusia_phi.AAC.10